jgi:hypothetical protein
MFLSSEDALQLNMFPSYDMVSAARALGSGLRDRLESEDCVRDIVCRIERGNSGETAAAWLRR